MTVVQRARTHRQPRLVTFIRTLIPILILALGIGSCTLLTRWRTDPDKEIKAIQPPMVETAVARNHTGDLDIKADGNVVPFREITVAAEVAGRVTVKAVVCNAGEYVTAGTLLIAIDPRDYELEVKRLSKEYDQAQVTLQELGVKILNVQELILLAEKDLKLQQGELARLESLGKSRVISESEVDQERRDELAARNALVNHRNQLRLLNIRRSRLQAAADLVTASLEKAKLDLARTRIVAPVDGVIVSDAVEQGSYVQRGSELFAIEDTAAVEVQCNLRMDQIYWLWPQTVTESNGSPPERINRYQLPATPATVIYRLGDNQYSWRGTLSRYDGIGVDRRTRMVPCRVVVNAPRDVSVAQDVDRSRSQHAPPALVRGMYVTVYVHAATPIDLVAIPESAVRPGKVVWCVVNGRLEIKQISVVSVVDGQVLVRADPQVLDAGDLVVVSPLARAEDGLAVTTEAVE